MRPVVLTLAVWSVLCAGATAAPQFNIDFSVGWQGCYRPLEWTPVEIGIGSLLKKPFGGTVTVFAQQDELTSMNILHPIVVTPNVPLYLPLVTKLAYPCHECRVEILDDRGRTCWNRTYSLWDYSQPKQALTAVGTADLLIGVCGRPAFGLADLPDRSECHNLGRAVGKVYVRQKLPRLLPWDWTGYACLDLLILYDTDWDQLNPHQVEAICQWVSNGGRVLFVLGIHPLPAKHPFARLLPAPLGQPRRLTIDRQTLGSWGVAPDGTGDTVTCWLPAAAGRGAGAQAGGPPIFAAGPVGFGRAGVIGCDPSVLGGRQKENLAPFWNAYLPHVLGGRTIAAKTEDSDSSSSGYSYGYDLGIEGAGSNAVLAHLMNIGQLRPISIWWVIMLLLALAVLLGPVDYLLLKKFDRLPLTWATSACYLVLFSAGAYYGVQELRGGALQMRVVTVVDGIEGTDAAWSTWYSGIFAPSTSEYRLAGLGPKDWWSAIAPHGDFLDMYRESWGGRRIDCAQNDGANQALSVPISIWSMQCLLGEAPVDRMPVSAAVQGAGDAAVVTVTNRSEQPIARGSIRVSGDREVAFGYIPAGQSLTVAVQNRFTSSSSWEVNTGETEEYYVRGRYASRTWEGEEVSPSGNPQAAYFAHGCRQRTAAMLERIKDGAIVVCARYENPPVPFSITGRRCEYEHVKLVRLLVLPAAESGSGTDNGNKGDPR